MPNRFDINASSCHALSLLTQGRYADAIKTLKQTLSLLPSQMHSTEEESHYVPPTPSFTLCSMDLGCLKNINSKKTEPIASPIGSPIAGIFNCAFELVYDVNKTRSLSDIDLVALSVTTLFNLALAFHGYAVTQGKSAYYAKSLQLYNTVTRVIHNADNKQAFLPILLACHFNKMRIFSDFLCDSARATSEQTSLKQIITMHKGVMKTDALARDVVSMMYYHVLSENIVVAAAA
jgi:hypothetical protein